MQVLQKRSISLFTLFICFSAVAIIACKQTINHITMGPKKGTLIAIGGAAEAPIFFEQFADFAGGKDAKIVIIPTAAGEEYLSKDPEYKNYKSWFAEKGFSNFSILHTSNPKEANDPSFYKPLETATGVWITGGRQWRLMDSYGGTKTLEALNALLDRGGVIAGSSAGATIQGSYLARGDTKTNTIMMGDHEEGFGFISNIAIDQHLLKRNRQFDMFDILDNRSELLGIGLDENTGIVVRGNEFEVIGNSYVAVYDGKMWSEDKQTYRNLNTGSHLFYLLKSGDRYNMKKREKIK